MTDQLAAEPQALPIESTYGDRMLRSIRRIVRRVSQYSRDLSLQVDLTVPQLTCLKAIAENTSETLTAREVSQRVSLSPATVSRIVDRLVRKGLLERRQWEGDRRKVLLTLTLAGQERYQTLPTPLDERFLARLEHLPEDERVGLLDALERIVELMDAKFEDAAPILVDGVDVKSEPKLLGAMPAELSLNESAGSGSERPTEPALARNSD